MKRILLLGGVTEALAIARTLGPQHIYSLAGVGRVPTDLSCQVRVGGYGGAQGLAQFIDDQAIDLLLTIPEGQPDRYKAEKKLEELVASIHKYDVNGLGAKRYGLIGRLIAPRRGAAVGQAASARQQNRFPDNILVSARAARHFFTQLV